MEGVRPWQIAVMVLGALGMGAGVYFSVSGPSAEAAISDRIVMVDIRTGELFETPNSSSRSMLLPSWNPKTGTRTLYPVRRSESGEWMVSDRFLSGIGKDDPAEALIDRKTGTVRLVSEDPTRFNAYDMQRENLSKGG